MITAVYLQNDSSISQEWWNHSVYQLSKWTIPVFHWNDDNNKTLLSLYLLWPQSVVGKRQPSLSFIGRFVFSVFLQENKKQGPL